MNITELLQRPDTTRVMLPRFEYETDPEKAINDRELVQRAAKRRWLSSTAVNLLLQAQRLPAAHKALDTYTGDVNKRDGWWGQYHGVRSRTSRFVDMPTPFHRPLGQTRLWLTGHTHDYCWDAQALAGHSVEIVLNGFNDYKNDAGQQCGEIKEFGALLINGYRKDEQRFVIGDNDGNWHGPETELDMSRAASMVFAMTYISLNEINQHHRSQ